jgi:hypothetical protein
MRVLTNGATNELPTSFKSKEEVPMSNTKNTTTLDRGATLLKKDLNGQMFVRFFGPIIGSGPAGGYLSK